MACGATEANTDQNRCAATDTLPHLQALRTMANDIEPAFPDLRDDARFTSTRATFVQRSMARSPVRRSTAPASERRSRASARIARPAIRISATDEVNAC
jgi:hypothetical protein